MPCDLRQKLLKGTVRATTAERRDILKNVESPVLPSFRTDEIQEAQRTDPVLGRIWHYIERGRNATRGERRNSSETAITMEPPTHLFWPIVQNNDRSHKWRHSKPVVASKFHEERSIRGIT